MPRELDSDSIAHVSGEHVRPVIAIELDYPDGPVRVCSLPFDINLDGEIFISAAAFGSLSGVEEGAELRSYGVQAVVAGIPLTFLRYLAAQKIQGRGATIFLAFVDSDHVVIGSPTVLFRGRMDTQDVEAGDTASVSVALESLLIEWDRARNRRWTDADQKSDYPEDRGLEYVATVANQEIIFGAS